MLFVYGLLLVAICPVSSCGGSCKEDKFSPLHHTATVSYSCGSMQSPPTTSKIPSHSSSPSTYQGAEGFTTDTKEISEKLKRAAVEILVIFTSMLVFLQIS